MDLNTNFKSNPESDKGGFTFQKLLNPLSEKIVWGSNKEKEAYSSLSVAIGLLTAGVFHGIYATIQGVSYLANKVVTPVDKNNAQIVSIINDQGALKVTKKSSKEEVSKLKEAFALRLARLVSNNEGESYKDRQVLQTYTVKNVNPTNPADSSKIPIVKIDQKPDGFYLNPVKGYRIYIYRIYIEMRDGVDKDFTIEVQEEDEAYKLDLDVTEYTIGLVNKDETQVSSISFPVEIVPRYIATF